MTKGNICKASLLLLGSLVLFYLLGTWIYVQNYFQVKEGDFIFVNSRVIKIDEQTYGIEGTIPTWGPWDPKVKFKAVSHDAEYFNDFIQTQERDPAIKWPFYVHVEKFDGYDNWQTEVTINSL